SCGNRVESSAITNAVGTKNKKAARNHKLIEDVPLCAAAAIHRGPSTVTILNSRTSQKPITRGSLGLEFSAESSLTPWRPKQESTHPAPENSAETPPANSLALARFRRKLRVLPPEKSSGPPVFWPGAYHA